MKTDLLKEFKNISIVVIGYNEAKNLDNTFTAIQKMNYPKDKFEIIYVDSGSTDTSLDIAKEYTNKIFIEDKFPSPGRNRNRGLVEAKYDIVHFIDGDVIIDANYLINIVNLFGEKDVQAIVGQLDEQKPTFFNSLSALTNVEKVEGYTHFTSTGATYLRSVLISIDGYDERIRRGQEMELGERLRNAGYKVWCTHHLMGSHNFGISNLWQYIQKHRIVGISIVQRGLMKGNNIYINRSRKLFRKNLILIFLIIFISALSIMFKFYWLIIAFLFYIWFLRTRWLLKKLNSKKTNLILCELMINPVGYVMFLYGFIKELLSIQFNAKKREFYNLRKMSLK